MCQYVFGKKIKNLQIIINIEIYIVPGLRKEWDLCLRKGQILQ